VRACLMGGGVQPAPSYSARYTNGSALAAGAPIRSRTLRPAILIDREHGGTPFASDDRPSGAPAQKSKQHQDSTSGSHKLSPLLCCRHLLEACNHARLSGAKKNARPAAGTAK
jgi:hypothetical protein